MGIMEKFLGRKRDRMDSVLEFDITSSDGKSYKTRMAAAFVRITLHPEEGPMELHEDNATALAIFCAATTYPPKTDVESLKLAWEAVQEDFTHMLAHRHSKTIEEILSIQGREYHDMTTGDTILCINEKIATQSVMDRTANVLRLGKIKSMTFEAL